MDEDLHALDRETLINEVRRLRRAIRAHRDSSEHDLCRHPQLWSLLPEQADRAGLVAIHAWLRALSPVARPATSQCSTHGQGISGRQLVF